MSHNDTIESAPPGGIEEKRYRMLRSFSSHGIPAFAILQSLGIESEEEITHSHLDALRVIWRDCEASPVKMAKALGTTMQEIARRRSHQAQAINQRMSEVLRDKVEGLMARAAKAARRASNLLDDAAQSDTSKMTAMEKAQMATACARASRDIAAVGTALFEITERVEKHPLASSTADNILRVIIPVTATVEEWNKHMPDRFRQTKALPPPTEVIDVGPPRPKDVRADGEIGQGDLPQQRDWFDDERTA